MKINSFMPYENIIYESNLAYDEIINRIQNIIEPRKIFIRKIKNDNGRPYEGELHENTFRMNRIILYTNSFIPIIHGTIIKENNKTKIKIIMKLHIFVSIFMSLYFMFFAFEFLADMRLNAFPFTPMAIIFFGYILMTGMFKIETKKSKEYLKRLFEA
jgi:hypothetical protein